MEHFVKRNFNGIFGAGGPKKPDPPAPPTLTPPKLGDLQAISSYEYVESIDLISDGIIDGWVNQRGEYVEDLKLFESIYLNDVAVKTTLPSNSGASIGANFNLGFIGNDITGIFYPSGFSSGFRETGISYLVDSVNGQISYQLSGNLSGVIKYSYLDGRSTISQDILQTIKNIPVSGQSSESTISQQFKLLKSKFNYRNREDVANYLLPADPNAPVSDYPFSCLKLSFFIPLSIQTGFQNSFGTGYSTFSYGLNSNIALSNDIANYSFKPFEADQLQKQEYYCAPKKINLAYFTDELNENYPTGFLDSVVTGSVYLFFDKVKDENDIFVPTQGAVDSIIHELKQLQIGDYYSKYNYSNAMFEVRQGEALQKPLSLFSQTYNDVQYNTRLKGPFEKGTSLSSLSRRDRTTVEADFNEDSYPSGTLPSGTFEGISNYQQLPSIHTLLFPTDPVEEAKYKLDGQFLAEAGGSLTKFLSKTELRIGSQDYIAFSFERNFVSYDNQSQKVSGKQIATYYLNKNTGYFKKSYNIKSSANAGGRDVNFLANDSTAITSLGTMTSFPSKVAGSKQVQAQILRFCIEQARVVGGSDDNRPTNNFRYADWNKDYVNYTRELATPVTHIVDNPNVSRVYVTLGLRVLKDTAETTLKLQYRDEESKIQRQNIKAGDPIPSLINVKIETGEQDRNGNESIYFTSSYQIKGYAESQATIDIGRPENTPYLKDKFNRFILGIQNIATPITLPAPSENKIRFVRVTRTTHESYSTLVKREISLEKISEVIDVGFSYPYSAVAGLKLDARTLSEIPPRSYDARFKKVFVPSNYFPLKANGSDKRYISFGQLASFNSLSSSDRDKIVYQGNWDGTFKLAWTDNPAWIVFDLLINRRYGLGNFISPEQVNYWELYKIARFCDAVDENGVFVGVPAFDGGLEPRYSFNGVIADKTNVFEALKSIISSFRGNLFYTNSEINFTNDRLKPIMAFFNNANVKDGFFNYSNERKDLSYNVIEVSYLDKDDLFKQKIEYVENPDDIKEKGILRTSAQTFGITSRSQAQRIGKHILYATVNEDQNVSFTASNEVLLCRPGDLISINDEVKTFKRLAGRVIDIDNYVLTTNISLSSFDFSSSGLLPEISVLIPTGKLQSADFYDLAKSPTKLSVANIYQTDVPITVTFPATGTGVSDSPSAVSYGSKFYIDPATATGAPLFSNIKIGTPCSITLKNTKQEVYKIQSIKELNVNEYEVFASKFDTGKFAEIETSESLDFFFNLFPASRTTQVNEGSGLSLTQQFKYGLTGLPTFITVASGNLDLQDDSVDISGSWNPVDGADVYDVDLYVPGKPYFNVSGNLYPYLRQTVETTNAVFYDRSEIGQFTMKVRARTTGDYPNNISASQTSGIKIVSYQPPTYTNAFVNSMTIAK